MTAIDIMASFFHHGICGGCQRSVACWHWAPDKELRRCLLRLASILCVLRSSPGVLLRLEVYRIVSLVLG